MAEKGKGSPLRLLRPLVFLLILGGAGFGLWAYQHRREGYTGGDVRTTGTIEAVHVDLSFKVGGRLAEVRASEGDTVSAGQLVARLEPADLDVQLGSARAGLASARAALSEARASREKAVRDLARQRALLQSDATTQQQVDSATAAADVARAQVAAAEAQVRQAESALAQAILQRSYAELRSPAAGQISEKVRQPGEIIMVGAPVLALAELDTVKVHAAVDETRVGAVRPGDRISARVYSFDRRLFEGRVTDIQPAGEFATRKDWGAQRRDIRTFMVTARVPNADHLLKDGMTAEVTIHVSPAVRKLAGAGR
jgi:RND family efflux transporter MFP subunit